jgi:hypothetical protein
LTNDSEVLAIHPSKQIALSARTDKNLFMSNAAAASNIVSLDDYRRSRGGDKKTMSPPMQTTTPATPAAPAVWVYWVPVWVW